MSNENARWYRHPWPWLLMSGPAVVVVAATWTAVLAVRSSDGLVTEDYYRQGMAINRVLARERHANDLGIVARLAFDGARKMRIDLPPSAPASAGLRLVLTHPAHASDDESIEMAPAGNGVYEGSLRSVPQGVSRIVLEDREQTWRIEAAMRGAPQSLTLGIARGRDDP